MIPDTLGGNPVTSIGFNAFSGDHITSVTIPDSVTTIGNNAFTGCMMIGYDQLTSVTIGNSVTTIGDWAFGQNNLTSVTIPDSVITIGNYAFNNNQLTSVTIGNSVTTIGNYAFNNNQLTSLTIGDSVTTIGDWAFGQNKLTSVTIPDSVTTIGDSAFAYGHLTSVTIDGDNITSAGTNIFQYSPIVSFTYNGTTYTGSDVAEEACFKFDAATKTITGLNFADIPTIRDHGQACLSNNLIIPSSVSGVSVTTIGGGAFSNNQLTSITIPDSVTTIGFYAFRGNQLTSVTIPDSVTNLGSRAFAHQTEPGSNVTYGSINLSDTDYTDDENFYNNAILTQIYASPATVSALGLSNTIITENQAMAGHDFNQDGDTADAVSGYIINPSYAQVNYVNKSSNAIQAPSFITGYNTSTSTPLTSYLVKDNPTGDMSMYYSQGDTANLPSAPSISGYNLTSTPPTSLTLANVGANNVNYIYQAKSSGAGGSSSSPTTTINTGSTQLGSSNHLKTTSSDSIPIISAKPTFSGTTYPNATVTVTVHSDPISCTTTADTNGKWSCTLPKDLTPGEHTVYVKIVHGSTTDNLGPYKVRVVAGAPTNLSSDNLAGTGMNVSLITTLAIALIVLASVAGGLVLYGRHKRA